MRDFIFRAFDKVDNKMYHHFDMPDKYILTLRGEIWDLGPGYGVGHIMRDRFELMQFTGLKDKNGAEIYEGDIVRIDTDKPMTIGWSDKFASFVIMREGWAFKHWFGEACDPYDCEVIGNIHEHKHLLE